MAKRDTNTEPQVNGTTVILAWDEVWGLHVQVRGDVTEARRVVGVLAATKLKAAVSEALAGLRRREGFVPVALAVAERDDAIERTVRGSLQKSGYEVEPAEGVERVPFPYGEWARPLLRRGSFWDGAAPLTAAEVGLKDEDLPEVLRLAVDTEFDMSPLADVPWAPVWAWFLVGELMPSGGKEVLLGLLDRLDSDEGDEAVSQVLPVVFGRMGREMVPELTAVLRDEKRGIYARWAAVNGLREIVEAQPEAKAKVVEVFVAQLEHGAPAQDEVNAAIIDVLITWRAVETADVIERAFRGRRVDESITGDWDHVQVELGLKQPPQLRPGFGDTVKPEGPKVGRNDPCPCGSGRKFKKCCGG